MFWDNLVEERLNIWITMETKHCIAHVFFVYLIAGITGNIAVFAIYKTILQDWAENENENGNFIPIRNFVLIFLTSPLERYLNFWKTTFSVNFQDIIDCWFPYFFFFIKSDDIVNKMKIQNLHSIRRVQNVIQSLWPKMTMVLCVTCYDITVEFF